MCNLGRLQSRSYVKALPSEYHQDLLLLSVNPKQVSTSYNAACPAVEL